MKHKNFGRFISKILRHEPEIIGTELDEHGYIPTEVLLNGISKHFNTDFTMEMLEDIVANNNKQRFSFNADKTLIRANQGHSIPVDLGLEPVMPPPFLYHGTAWDFTKSIDKEGLKPMTRLQVHLSPDTATARVVGRRHSKRHGQTVIYKVLSGKMYEDGYEFVISDNGVWLTDFVPAKYLEKLA